MPSIRLALSFCLVAATLVVGGCEKSESRSPRSARNVPKKVAPKPGPEVLVKVSEEEARAFAEKLEAAVLAQDHGAFKKLIDWNAIIARTTAGMPLQPEVIRDFRKGALNSSEKFLRSQTADPEFTFRLVNVRVVEGATWATFRNTGADGLRDYSGFLLSKKNGETIATEVYRYILGQTMSQCLRGGARIVLASFLAESGAKLDPQLAEYLRHREKIERITTLVQQRDPHAVLAVYDSLPPTMRRDKFLLLIRYQMAELLGGDALDSACRDMHEAYPHDTCIDLMMLGYWVEEGRSDKALVSLDRIDHAVGSDPYLNTLRANILVHSGQLQEARRRAELAIRDLPDMADPYWSMVDVALLAKDYELLAPLLEKLRREFHFDLSEVPLSPVYAEFLDSQPGREWLALQTGGMGVLR